MLSLNKIRIDGGTQSRVSLDQDVVNEYSEAFKSGAKFPPVVVFFDGTSYWLADGFHRYFGAKQASINEIWETIEVGTKRDAILYSLKANAQHGLRRSNEDKRKAVETLLNDAEWASWSQEKIAIACGVSTGMVSKMVNSLSLHGEEIRTKIKQVERNGVKYQQDTSNIGKVEPIKKSLPEPAPSYEYTPSESELNEAEAEIIAREELVNEILNSDDVQGDLAKSLVRKKQAYAILESRNNGLMNENASLVKIIKSRDREISKLKKIIEEFNMGKAA